MHTIDSGDGDLPIDIVDAGDTASPPADAYSSFHNPDAQTISGAFQPVFHEVNDSEAISPAEGLALHVRVGGTSTTVTIEIPGAQPYTDVARDDLVAAGLQNTERVFHLPALTVDPDSEVAVVTYNPPTATTAAVLQVN